MEHSQVQATSGSEFHMIMTDQLVESKLNPRRQYNADRLKELADSIMSVGMIEPLVVRLNGQRTGATEPHYEIIAGSRRFRAAQMAGTKEIPVLIREMTDEQALEIMVIENNQRQDVNALEEAEGYEKLMRLGYGLDRLAERIGRAHKYIYDRIKLLQLVPEAKNLVLEGIISAGHAILLARLRPEEQKRAMDDDNGGLWEHEQLLWNPNDVNAYASKKTRSVRELQAWIDEHVRFDKKAPTDVMLFPDTVQMVKQAVEEKEKIVQITHNHYTQPDAKEGNTERIYHISSWKRADKSGTKEVKPCDKSVTGVIVVGPDRGEAYKVCVHKDCDVHWGKERRVCEKAKASGSRTKWQQEVERRNAAYKREQELREKRHTEWKAARKSILEACAAKVKASKPGVLAEAIYRRFRNDELKDAQSLLGKKWKSAEDLLQLFATAALLAEYNEWNAYTSFPARAKRIGVDVKGILKTSQIAKIYPEPTCNKCGCTELKACAGGCSWSKLDNKTNEGLCSSCSPVHTSAKTKKRQRDKKKK